MRVLKFILAGIFVVAVAKVFLYSQAVFIRALESEKEIMVRQTEFIGRMGAVYNDFEKVLGNIHKYVGLHEKEYEAWQNSFGLQKEKIAALQEAALDIKRESQKLKSEFALKNKKLEDEIAALQKAIAEKDKAYQNLHLKYIDLLNKFSSPLILKKRIKELREERN